MDSNRDVFLDEIWKRVTELCIPNKEGVGFYGWDLDLVTQLIGPLVVNNLEFTIYVPEEDALPDRHGPFKQGEP